MLLLPEYISQKELKKTKEYFSLPHLIVMAKKVVRGLGTTIKTTDEYSVVKLKTTFKGVAGRSIFFCITENNDVIPLLLRMKIDPVGENMSFQNKAFCKAFEKNTDMVFDDIENGRVEVFDLSY